MLLAPDTPFAAKVIVVPSLKVSFPFLLLLLLAFFPLCPAVRASIPEGTTPSGAVTFTDAERAYLQAKGRITMCIDPDWLPLEKLDNGRHIGMTADYFELFQQKIPVPITLIPTTTWPQSIEYAMARKCDIFSLAMSTPERERYMNFTEPYLRIPLVMAARVDRPFVDDITTLKDVQLGVVKGYAFGELLRRRYPKMHIVDVASVGQGLQQVVDGALGGFIGTLATVGYAIQKDFPLELKVAGKFDQRWELGVATRSDEPLLLSVFDKVIASVERTEQQRILNRWIAVKFEQGTNYVLIWRLLLVAGIGICFLLYRNYALGRYNRTLKQQNEKISRQSKQLQEIEDQLLLTKHAVDGSAFPVLWAINGDTLADTRVIYANQAAMTLLGFTSEEVVQLSLAELDAGLTDEEWRQGLLDLQKESSLPLSTRYRRCGGETIPVDLFASVFDSRGQAYLFLFFVDMTRQNELEEKLHRSMRMESIGLMAGGVAHDLNNILSGVIGYPELILYDLPADSKLRQPLEMIKDSGTRAAAVVADLLTVARGIAAEKVVANLNTLIGEYLQSAEFGKLRSGSPGADCVTDLEADLLNISCSPVHVKKCLMNIVTNAVEALGQGGRVTITTRNQYLEAPSGQLKHLKKGEYAVVSISDEGSGIAASDLEHIFEPFYTKKKMGRSGTGLGLAIVWNTMDDHGGAITVESGAGGTVFELYFPATRQVLAPQVEGLSLEDVKGRGETILVVDDESQQLDIATKILTSLNYEVAAVNSGEAALRYLERQAVDLVVLDMVMEQGLNGRETYEQMIRIRPGQKAIIVSGFSQNAEVEKAQQLGVGQFVKKPYLRNQIGLAVKGTLAAKRVVA